MENLTKLNLINAKQFAPLGVKCFSEKRSQLNFLHKLHMQYFNQDNRIVKAIEQNLLVGFQLEVQS